MVQLMGLISPVWLRSREEMVLADMHLKPGEPWDICPRDALHRVSKILKDEFNLVMSAGFENEFYLLKSVQREGKEEWTPFDLTPYCSTSSFDLLLPCFMKLLLPSSLAHSCGKEAGKGQFGLSLGHAICTSAAAYLVFRREFKLLQENMGCWQLLCRSTQWMTVVLDLMCISVSGEMEKNIFMASDGSSHHGMSKTGAEFTAGVHLSQIGLTSILAAGIDGLRRHSTLPEPIDENSANLDAKLQRLPKSLAESVEALEKDDIFKDLIDDKLLTTVNGVRKAEVEYCYQNKDAYKQLMHRYCGKFFKY
ncbi:LOW QUALITY PROTEIN: Glutamine synthetase, catalytic domain [Dillenia turbinata]|uniref:Glutamine synthetase, catalytic domain n=1 Tax=Dillenia turbinata TaxID=194707 RepID=A0AAN8VZL0_9MAGN